MKVWHRRAQRQPQLSAGDFVENPLTLRLLQIVPADGIIHYCQGCSRRGRLAGVLALSPLFADSPRLPFLCFPMLTFAPES